MKKMIFCLCFVLLSGFAFLNIGCYAHVNGAGVGMDIAPHDQRWHYYHDYDDDWRAHHRWHEDRQNWD